MDSSNVRRSKKFGEMFPWEDILCKYRWFDSTISTNQFFNFFKNIIMELLTTNPNNFITKIVKKHMNAQPRLYGFLFYIRKLGYNLCFEFKEEGEFLQKVTILKQDGTPILHLHRDQEGVWGLIHEGEESFSGMPEDFQFDHMRIQKLIEFLKKEGNLTSFKKDAVNLLKENYYPEVTKKELKENVFSLLLMEFEFNTFFGIETDFYWKAFLKEGFGKVYTSNI